MEICDEQHYLPTTVLSPTSISVYSHVLFTARTHYPQLLVLGCTEKATICERVAWKSFWGRAVRHCLQYVVNEDSTVENKNLSYRRETARQLPTWRGLSPTVHSPSPSGYTYAYGRIRNPQQTYVKRAVLKAHFKLNRAFKVIQGYPYLCRQEPRAVYCRNVQLIPPLFLKLTRIWQQEHSKFVDFNDPIQVWRRPSKKRLRISTNDLYCQKLVIGLHFCRW